MNKLIKTILLASTIAIIICSFLPIAQQILPSNIFLVTIRIASVLFIIFFYLKDIFVSNRFFIFATAISFSYIIAYFLPNLKNLPLFSLAILVLFCLIELAALYWLQTKINVYRIIPEIASLNSQNPIHINIHHKFFLRIKIEIIDEIPIELQERNFSITETILPFQNKQITYNLKPLQRGIYDFGNLHVYVHGLFGLLQKDIKFTPIQQLKVYPSIIQTKDYEKLAFESRLSNSGLKKIRKIGQNYEFAQIRNYIKGDDYRAINWKATSRKNELMVNTFEDEKAQQIFCVIDKGRQMHLAYNGMSILDYAINNALIMSNIIIKKQDKAGLLTFSDTIGSTIKANNGNKQLQTILEALFREKPRQVESNYNLLYLATKQFITRRSLLFLHTNFETLESMMNVLPVLRKIAKTHLLVVILFKNKAIEELAEKPAKNTFDIYQHAIAMRFFNEKQQMIFKLEQYGIQAILTDTQQLSTDVVNKYLELKARNMI